MEALALLALLWLLGRGGAASSAGVPAPPGVPTLTLVTAAEVVARALEQQGMGDYKLGGGALYTEANVFEPLGNRFPGFCDCTGLLAFAAKYKRLWQSTDGIVDEARGVGKYFHVVGKAEPVRAGDFIVTGRGHALPDHAGVIVEVLPTFHRGIPGWWRHLRIAHCVHANRVLPPEQREPGPDGPVRVTNAYRWRNTGYIIRPRHVIE